MVRELTEFFVLVQELHRLRNASLWQVSRKSNQAKRLSVLEELHTREPTVHAILEAVGYEPVTISDNAGSAGDLSDVTMFQLGLVIGAYEALDQGRAPLADYSSLLDRYPVASQAGPADPDSETLAVLRRGESAVKAILQRLDPALADFDINHPDGRKAARDAVATSLEIVDTLNRLDWQMASRSSDGPVMAADQLHPWVWEAVRGLCESGHYGQAVQKAATAVSAHTQDSSAATT